MTNHYDTLGVEKDASKKDIKKRYYELSMKHHPDKHSTASEEVRNGHEEEFKKISVAYGVLSDPEQRAQYDYELMVQSRHAQQSQAQQQPQQSWAQAQQSRQQTPQPQTAQQPRPQASQPQTAQQPRPQASQPQTAQQSRPQPQQPSASTFARPFSSTPTFIRNPWTYARPFYYNEPKRNFFADQRPAPTMNAGNMNNIMMMLLVIQLMQQRQQAMQMAVLMRAFNLSLHQNFAPKEPLVAQHFNFRVG